MANVEDSDWQQLGLVGRMVRVHNDLMDLRDKRWDRGAAALFFSFFFKDGTARSKWIAFTLIYFFTLTFKACLL